MHVTTRRSYLDKYNESIFYSKRHISLTVVPARWVSIALLHTLLTLLSKLKTSELKNLKNLVKCFTRPSRLHHSVKHAGSHVLRAYPAPCASAESLLHCRLPSSAFLTLLSLFLIQQCSTSLLEVHNQI